MLSVINPSQIQSGVTTFPRPVNPVSHNLSSSYNNITSTSSSYNNRTSHNTSCDVSAFQVNSNFHARSSSNSDNLRNHHTSSRAPELFHFSSSKHSTCSTTSSSSSSSVSSSSSRRGVMSQHQTMFSKQSWNNASQIFHPGYRNGFSSTLNQQQNHHHLMPHSSSSACWLDCLSSNGSEKVSSSASYPLSSQRRMSTNSSMNMGYNNLQQCTTSRLQEQDELEKVRKRLSVNNSLFCNPSTSRVTNRPLPQPDGSSSKDFTKTLFVDCSIEYELPNAPKIPKNSDPILMIHPGSKRKSSDGNTSRAMLIKEENERASKVEFENSGGSKLCSSSKCSCPEAVQYRKKYRLHLEQQRKQQQQKSFVKKEIDANDNINNGDNQNSSTRYQERSSSVLQSGCKRSYAQAMNVESKHNILETRNGVSKDAMKDELSSAFQHPTTSSNSDCSGFYSGNNLNSGRSHFNTLQRMQIDHLRNSSRSGDIQNLSSSTNKLVDETVNDSTAAFMDQLEYISKGRSISSDGISSNPPSSKRSRMAYHSQQELHHRKLQQQQRAHHQETLMRKQEAAAVVMAQHQRREQFIHTMRARQHQERQAALSTLAAANLAAFNRQQPATTQQLTRYTTNGGGSCYWPAYGSQTVANRSRHQLHQMSSFQQITPPGSVPFCWGPGPASGVTLTSVCPPTCSHPTHGGYGHHEKTYGMDLTRSKQMAAMACCYGSHNQHSNLVPAPIACAATPALTGGNPNTVAAAAAAAAMAAGAPYCQGCVQGKCQVTWNKENAVHNGIMRSL